MLVTSSTPTEVCDNCCVTKQAVKMGGTSIHSRVSRQARTQTVHWVHVHPPPHPPTPTWEKSSTQKCPEEERKLRPDMSAKKNVHVPLRYDKIKMKI